MAINKTADGREWLTEKQLDELLFEIQNFSGKSLHEANKEIHRLLLKGTTVNKNELTGEQNPTVRLVDFKNSDKNSFIAINQFRLLTPGASREGIIPDIVLFLNGLPVIVVEAKDFDAAEPLSEVYLQITRYANTREDDYGVKEGEEKLFHYNIFSVITRGKDARIGTNQNSLETLLNVFEEPRLGLMFYLSNILIYFVPLFFCLKFKNHFNITKSIMISAFSVSIIAFITEVILLN